MTKRSSGRLFRGIGSTHFAALLAALVFVSGLEIHPAGEVRDSLPGLAREDGGSALAAAPERPLQLSAAAPSAAKRPLCPACLHRLLTGGAHLPAAELPLGTALAGRTLEPARSLLLPPPSHRLGARAPPLS
ncbi:MAG TPA: hypothetical protein VGE98_01110 [Thermoanaerobaculia bacterium]